MKKAFTMVELVFVVVLLGLLSYFAWPKSYATKAFEAANQIVSHMRYTQHLAMSDDKYSTDDENWYKKQWKITFNNLNSADFKTKCKGDEAGWRYAVYHNDGTDKSQPNSNDEVASNPGEPGKLLSACYTGLVSDTSSGLNLAKTYGITDIAFSGDWVGILFDELGRAYSSAGAGSKTEPYSYAPLIKDDATEFATITLSAKDGSQAIIRIYPQTGFVCVDGADDCRI